VVVPTLGAGRRIAEVVEQIRSALNHSDWRPFEVIVVDDGSRDDTWPWIKEAASGTSEVIGVRLTRNFGEESAVAAGIRLARAPYIVTLDDDLYHDPRHIPALLERLQQGYDLVYGVPSGPARGILRRSLTFAGKRLAAWAIGIGEFARASSFRAFRAQVAEPLRLSSGPHPVVDVALLWVAGQVEVVGLPPSQPVGRSRYSLGSLFAYFMDVVTTYSVKPLRLLLALGAASLVVGVSAVVALAADVAAGGGHARLILTLVVLFVLSGLLGVSTGLLGEYTGRLKASVEGLPPFAFRECVGPKGGFRAQGPERIDAPEAGVQGGASGTAPVLSER
jgi:hypothetical protein